MAKGWREMNEITEYQFPLSLLEERGYGAHKESLNLLRLELEKEGLIEQYIVRD